MIIIESRERKRVIGDENRYQESTKWKSDKRFLKKIWVRKKWKNDQLILVLLFSQEFLNFDFIVKYTFLPLLAERNSNFFNMKIIMKLYIIMKIYTINELIKN